ncbi:MAG: HAMP domain-containing protein [Nitrospirae bacterium]|nr:HAMP domain-containing protein [Nitrospirota bacterium]
MNELNKTQIIFQKIPILIQRFKNSIILRVMSVLFIILIIGGILSWYSIYYKSKGDMINAVVNETFVYSEIIKNSLNHAGSNNQRDELQKTLETIGKGYGISGLWIINHKGIIKSSSKPEETGNSFSADSYVCKQCHTKNIADLTNINKRKWILTEDLNKSFNLKAVEPIINDKSCSTTACHPNAVGHKYIGFLVVEHSSMSLLERIIKIYFAALTFNAIFFIITAIAIFVILWKIVLHPLSKLSNGMEMIAKGNLDYTIDINTNDEIGKLAQSFNTMRCELKTSRERLEGSAKSLEDDMENITTFFAPFTFALVKTLEDELAKKAEEFKRAQVQHMHTEKLASLGRMAASVAHELNSPLTGIVVFSNLLLKRVPSDNKQDIDDVKIIIDQAEKCARIVSSLLKFSRSIPSEKKEVDINEAINKIIYIIKNQSKFQNVKIETNLSPDLIPQEGDTLQIEQVFINLLINAADAMDNKGTITFKTSIVTDVDGKIYAEIVISDTGPGIAPEHIGRLFEPFFTTKPEGKGTGLGLSVSMGIVQKHGGKITVKSDPGNGASFFVRLPINRII